MEEDPFVFAMIWNDLSKEESFKLYIELRTRTQQLEEKMSLMERQFKKELTHSNEIHMKDVDKIKEVGESRRLLELKLKRVKDVYKDIQRECDRRNNDLEKHLSIAGEQLNDLTVKIEYLKSEQEQLHDEVEELKSDLCSSEIVRDALAANAVSLNAKLDTSNKEIGVLMRQVSIFNDRLIIEKSTNQKLTKETLDTKELHMRIQNRHRYILWWLSSNPLILDKIRTNEYIMGMLRENQHIMDLICKKQSLNELQTAISKYPHIR